MILFVILMCAVGALAFLHNAPNRPVNRQAAAPSQTLTPTPAPTIAPTPSPKPTPTPTPDGSHLLDGEPWYQQRNSDLRAMLKRNGTFHSEQEIDDAVAGMSIDPTKPMVALTFDDGPVKGVTDEILDILAQYNVRATFFYRRLAAAKARGGGDGAPRHCAGMRNRQPHLRA